MTSRRSQLKEDRTLCVLYKLQDNPDMTQHKFNTYTCNRPLV